MEVTLLLTQRGIKEDAQLALCLSLWVTLCSRRVDYGEQQGLGREPERVYSRLLSPPSLRLLTKEKQPMQTSKEGTRAEGCTACLQGN